MKAGALTCCALLVCTAATFTATAATQAQFDFAKRRCEYQDDPSIVRAVSLLDEADKLLPNIPPEEERYLKAEREAALRLGSEERKTSKSAPRADQMFTALQARPMYAVYELRRSLERARTEVKRILEPDGIRAYPNNAEAEKLARAARAVPDVASYEREVSEFVSNRQRAFVDQEKTSKLHIDALLMPLTLGEFIGCKLAKITTQN